MDWYCFCDNIKEILELDKYKRFDAINWKIDDKNIIISIELDDGIILEYSYTKNKFLKEYLNNNNNELSIIYKNYYEVPISIKNEHFPIMPRYDRVIGKEYSDDENELKYKIDTPSNEFLFKMVELKIRPNAIMMLRRLPIFEKMREGKGKIEKKTILDLLRMVYRDCITLKINSIHVQDKIMFEHLADAFIFSINYNMDIGIRQTYDLENIHERRINTRFRNVELEKISAPKRIYKKELVEQYNMASITEDPFIQYLCYYHILEHFYEHVYKEQLITIVKEQLTMPNFSIKKDKEIIKLIDRIKEKIKVDKQNFDGDELESLELVIKKYIDIDSLQSKIEENNDQLVDYYDKQKINFSKGIPVNFNDKENLYKNIAKRIYSTRNALVHYKSNDFTQKEKGMYRPFDDRPELTKEVPLIRILAEEVIIKNSIIF